MLFIFFSFSLFFIGDVQNIEEYFTNIKDSSGAVSIAQVVLTNVEDPDQFSKICDDLSKMVMKLADTLDENVSMAKRLDLQGDSMKIAIIGNTRSGKSTLSF